MNTENIVVNIYGPRGCGKTHNAKALAESIGATCVLDDVFYRGEARISGRVRVGKLLVLSEAPIAGVDERIPYDVAMSRVKEETNLKETF